MNAGTTTNLIAEPVTVVTRLDGVPWGDVLAVRFADAGQVFDLQRVIWLGMYLREALYLVRLDGDDALRSVSLDAWCALRRAVSSDPARRLVPVPGGRDDVIWRVERLDAPVEEARP